MATTKEMIRSWLKEAKKKKATHMLVVCDTFDWEDYPVPVKPNEDVRKIYAEHHGPNMQKVMEVYNLSMDLEQQIQTAGRVMNF